MTRITHFDGLTGMKTVRFASLEAAEDCAAPGDCQTRVENALDCGDAEMLCTHAEAAGVLLELGAWDDLHACSNRTLEERLVWIAACDIREDPDLYAGD